MSGIFRNILAALFGFFKYGSVAPLDSVSTTFRITPFDTGFARLKSDKYFQLAETAQLDFGIKTGLFGILFKHGYSFVNASQLIKFSKPIHLFSAVEVKSQIIYWDNKCAYFEHAFFVQGSHCARVLVKMKFKKGSKTIDPVTLIGQCASTKSPSLNYWDNAINDI